MALERSQMIPEPQRARDPNCVSCMLEHNQGIDDAIADLAAQGKNYDHLKESLSWRFPKNPQACAYHLAEQGEPRNETTRMRAVRIPPTADAAVEAKSAPMSTPVEPPAPAPLLPLPDWLQPAQSEPAPVQKPGDLNDSLIIFAKTGQLGEPRAKPGAVGASPGWLNTSENSHPLFEQEPPPLELRGRWKECPECQGKKKVWTAGIGWGPCVVCKEEGWIHPKAKSEARPPEKYSMMALPADRAAPLPPAEQPQQTGAMPALPPAESKRKLSSGEFPTLNAIMLRILRGEAQLSALRQPFCAEVAPWTHQLTLDAQTLADNVRMANEGLPRDQELFWLNIENALRLIAEYAERVERDLRTVPGLEARHAS